MDLEDQIGQLTQLGLNAYEAKAYAGLLGKNSFTAAQVADISGVPRQRIYDILASLVERGLAIGRPGKRGTTYAAVAPERALGGLLAREQQCLGRLQSVANQLIDTLTAEYETAQEESDSLNSIEVLCGRAAINERFAQIQESCRREILVLTKPPYAKPPQENREGIETVRRQIRACSIYEDAILRNAETRLGVASFIQHGEEARFVERLPLKLAIVDEAIVMFETEGPIAGRSDMTIMVIDNTQLARLLKAAFEALWNGGETFEAACERLGLPYDTPVLA